MVGCRLDPGAVDPSHAIYATILSVMAGTAFEAINQMVACNHQAVAAHLADLLWVTGVRASDWHPFITHRCLHPQSTLLGVGVVVQHDAVDTPLLTFVLIRVVVPWTGRACRTCTSQ